jgi:hypothetical protein
VARLKPVLPSAASSAERRKCEFWCNFPALRPVVVSVALKAARFRVLRPRRMAGLASFNSRQQDVARLRARQRLRVAAHASESLMRTVIEFCMRHPAQRCIGRRDVWQSSRDAGEFVDVTPPHDLKFDFSVRCSCRRCKRVALLTGFSPEQVFGFGGALRHPLRRSEDANCRCQRLTR